MLLTQELRQIAINQTELSKEQANRIIRLSEVGKASPAEVAEAKARVAQDQLSVTQASNNYQIALLDLSQLLELSSPQLLSIQDADTTFILNPLTPPDEIYQYALSSKPEIQAAQYRLLGSEKNIRIAQSGFTHSLVLGVAGEPASLPISLNISVSKCEKDKAKAYHSISASLYSIGSPLGIEYVQHV